jgi:hypothetical protein
VADRAELRAAAITMLALAAVGAVLGPVWAAWSGAQQRAYVLAPGVLYPYDEVETMAAADGRYLVIVAAVGLLAPIALWRVRDSRGPVAAAALAAGGLAGAALTWWLGYLTGGGSYTGTVNTTIAHLPLTLHMHGLLFVEPALTALGYGLIVAFAARDDLGRPEALPRPGQPVVPAGSEGGGPAWPS